MTAFLPILHATGEWMSLHHEWEWMPLSFCLLVPFCKSCSGFRTLLVCRVELKQKHVHLANCPLAVEGFLCNDLKIIMMIMTE